MMIKTIWTRIIISVSGFLGLGRRLGLVRFGLKLVGSRMMVRLVGMGMVGLVGMVGLSINTSYADLSGLYRSVNAARQSGLWSTESGSNITIHQDRGLVNAKHEYHGQLIIEKHEKLGIDQVRGDQTLTLILDGGMIMKGMIESVGRGVGHMVIIGKHGDMIITDHGQIHLGSFGMVNQDPLGLTENHGNIQVTRGNPIIIAAGGITNDQGGVETHANQARAILEFNPVSGVLTYVASKPNPEEDGQMLFDDSGTQIVYQGNTGGNKAALNNPRLITNRADFNQYLVKNNGEISWGLYWNSYFYSTNNFSKLTSDFDYDYRLNDLMPSETPSLSFNNYPILTEGYVVNYDGASHVVNHFGTGDKNIIIKSGVMSSAGFVPALAGSMARSHAHNFKLLNPMVTATNKHTETLVSYGLFTGAIQAKLYATVFSTPFMAGASLAGGLVSDVTILNGTLNLYHQDTYRGNQLSRFSVGFITLRNETGFITHTRVQGTINSEINWYNSDLGANRVILNYGLIIGRGSGLFIPNTSNMFTSLALNNLLNVVESSSVSGKITVKANTAYGINVGGIEGISRGKAMMINNKVGTSRSPLVLDITLEKRVDPVDNISILSGKTYFVGGVLGSTQTAIGDNNFILNTVHVVIKTQGLFDSIGGVTGGSFQYFRGYKSGVSPDSITVNHNRIASNFYKNTGNVVIQGSAVAMGGLMGSGAGIVKDTQINVNLNNGYTKGYTGGLIGYAGGLTQSSIDRSKIYINAAYVNIRVSNLSDWYSGKDAQYNVLIDHTTVTGNIIGAGNVGGFIGGIGQGDTALNDLIKNKQLPVVITNSSFGTILPPPVKGVINAKPQVLTNNSFITGETVGGMIGKIENTNYALNVGNSYVIANIVTTGQGAGILGGIPTDAKGNIITGYNMHIHSVFTAGTFTANEGATDLAGISVGNTGTIEDVYMIGHIVNNTQQRTVNLSMFVNNNATGGNVTRGYYLGFIDTVAVKARPGIAKNNGNASELYWDLQVEPLIFNDLGSEPYLRGISSEGFKTENGPIGKFGSAWNVNAKYGSMLNGISIKIQETVLKGFAVKIKSQAGQLTQANMDYKSIQLNNEMLQIRSRMFYDKMILYYNPTKPFEEVENLLITQSNPTTKSKDSY